MATIYTTAKDNLPARARFELYPTNRGLIRAALALVAPPGPIGSILDVGAGDGRWGLGAAERYAGQSPRPEVWGVELRDVPPPAGFDHWHQGDFTSWQPGRRFDLIVSNPPYGDRKRPPLCERIIRWAWELLATEGTMIMLLRLALTAGVGRFRKLWRTHHPVAVLSVARRPSFYGNGTNATDYGIYVWHKLASGQPAGRPNCWQGGQVYHTKEKEGDNAPA